MSSQVQEMVRAVLAPLYPCGLSTRQIFLTCLKQFPDASLAEPPPSRLSRYQATLIKSPHLEGPQKEHPIQSMRHLKRVILEGMEQRREIEKMRVVRGKIDAQGNHRDTILSKGREPVIVDNLATKDVEWGWRLWKKPQQQIPKDDST